MNLNKILSSTAFFAAGAGVGALIGILFAPDEGKATRAKLIDKLHEYRDNLNELIGRLGEHEENPEAFSHAKSEGKRLIQDTKNKAEKLLDDVESLIGKISEKK